MTLLQAPKLEDAGRCTQIFDQNHAPHQNLASARSGIGKDTGIRQKAYV